MKALLDTHILLWWWSAEPRLSTAQREVLEGADADNPLWVSEITLWEIANLHSLGRIDLDRPLRDWMQQAIAPPLVRTLGISPVVAAEVANLPSSFHRDPVDRILVATARVFTATLLTQDQKILRAELVQALS